MATVTHRQRAIARGLTAIELYTRGEFDDSPQGAFSAISQLVADLQALADVYDLDWQDVIDEADAWNKAEAT